MSAVLARAHALDMIRQAAERAAEKGVEVMVEYVEFTRDGKIEVRVTAMPSAAVDSTRASPTKEK